MDKSVLMEIITALPGWCTSVKAGMIYDLIKEHKPYLSVELGVFGGRSLVPIAIGHKDNNYGSVIGIDAWDTSASLEGQNDKANDEWWSALNYDDIYAHCLHAVRHYGINSYCCLARSKSLMIADMFGNQTIDFLHQDSNHSEEVTCNEVDAYAPKLRSGGIWISDDTNWPTVQKSLTMLTAIGFEKLQVVDNEEKTAQFTIWKKK